jgi:hypothetical protein
MSNRRMGSIAGTIAGLATTVGILSSLAYIVHTRALYAEAAPCSKLHGIPGLLQTAGFVTTGTCTTTKNNTCTNPNSTCTITNPPSGGSKTGYCVYSQALQSCTCSVKPAP